MHFLVTGFFLALALSANAFDSSNFVKKYCTETKDLIVCNYVQFTEAEKNDIQRLKFIISNAQKVEFHYSDIGSFNENLVNKFPNAVELYIFSSTVNFNYSASPISTNNAKLQRLYIEKSILKSNANSQALSKLTALKTIEIIFPEYLQFPYLDDVFLSKNTNLETVDIRGELIDSITSKAFSNLKKLTTLKIMNTNIAELNNTLIKSNTLLKEVKIDANQITNIPLNGFFPSALETISLRFNKLQVVTNKSFVGLNKLKVLSLAYNKISVVSNNAFVLPALEKLHLDNNNIVDLERKHISGCKNLKEVFVNNNKITKLSNDFFDDLNNLENVIIVCIDGPHCTLQ